MKVTNMARRAEDIIVKCFEGCACLRCKIDVTPEMIAAGMGVLAFIATPGDCGGVSEMEGFARRIYRAMHAVAPVPLVSEAEDRVAALEAERDNAYDYLRRVFETCAPKCTPLSELYGMCTQIDNLIAGYRKGMLPDGAIWVNNESYLELCAQRDEARQEADGISEQFQALYEQNKRLLAQRAAKDARIAELDTLLAQRPESPAQGAHHRTCASRMREARSGTFGVCDCSTDKRSPFRDLSGDRRRMGG